VLMSSLRGSAQSRKQEDFMEANFFDLDEKEGQAAIASQMAQPYSQFVSVFFRAKNQVRRAKCAIMAGQYEVAAVIAADFQNETSINPFNVTAVIPPGYEFSISADQGVIIERWGYYRI
jgi:hypothetical protein